MKKFFAIIIFIIIAVTNVFLFDFSSSAAANDDFRTYIVDNAKEYNKNIDVSYYMKKNGWDIDELQNQIKDIYLMEPEFFYISRTISFMVDSDGKKTYLCFDYLYSKAKVEEMKKKMHNEALKAVADIEENMNEAEKALVVHDYLILNTVYDHTDKKFSAYDCLVNKSAVCQGYSLAYVYIMRDILGIDCAVAVSDTQNHAWNYIKIGKYWYHVDLTADDPVSSTYEGVKYDSRGQVLHKNFLLSDKASYESSELHRDWYTSGLPAAKSEKYDNFFWKNSSSAIYKIDGLWYYSIIDNTSPGLNYKKSGKSDIYTKICSYSFDTKKRKVITKVDSTWNLYRNSDTGKVLSKNVWYKTSFVKLVKIDDTLYYNTDNAIYRLNLKTKKSKKIYTLKKENMSIYSITYCSDSKIRVAYKKDLSYKEKYLFVKLKKA